jgi:hypothetical protein
VVKFTLAYVLQLVNRVFYLKRTICSIIVTNYKRPVVPYTNYVKFIFGIFNFVLIGY